MKISVTCGSGMETALKLELRKFGIDAPANNGRFTFDGDCAMLAELNYKLRTADRVSIKLAEFVATTFDELFEQTANMPWADYLASDAQIIVTAKSVQSALFATSAMQSIGKKAIVTAMQKKYNFLPETGARHAVEFIIINDVCAIYLDASGVGLHKRGYRDMVWEAPIKETIASGILELSIWNPERPFIDPFVGSGTFPIECAMRAVNMPAGYLRKFDFEGFKFVDSGIMERLRKEGEAGILRDAKPRIVGYDINKKAVALAWHHAQNAGLEKFVHFETADMRTVASKYKFGVICTNPPYGERLVKSESELEILYHDFGKMFMSLDNWSLYVISAHPKFEKFFGEKSDKTRKLFNAGLECRLYRYLSKEKPIKSPRQTPLEEPLE